MTFEESGELTPDKLFEEIRRTSTTESGLRIGYRVMSKFKEVKDKKPFLKPTIKFLKEEKIDNFRAWGTNVLEEMKGNEAEEAFNFLDGLLAEAKTRSEKQTYRHTRFFAVKAMKTLASSEREKKKLHSWLKDLMPNSEEDMLVQAIALVLMVIDDTSTKEEKKDARSKIKTMLRGKTWLKKSTFWPRLRILRALREFPLEYVLYDIFSIIEERDSYLEHKRQAILALGGYRESKEWLRVVRKIGLILRTNDDSYLRLAAVQALSKLGYVEAQEDLLEALNDENAEVRVQTADALKDLLKADTAARTIIQYALEDPEVRMIIKYPERKILEKDKLTHLVEAMRRINPNRIYSSEVLSKELDGEDKERVRVADYILVDLGGWEAVQKIGQRRKTLETLRDNLREAEKAVTEAFKSTMAQAHRNFAFAMGINIIIVAVGICLIILAMWQLIQTPEKLESWLIPGGTGVLGLIISLTFNNSRQNAREDLTTLVNVSVIFQGFMRRLKEIDATFEKSYMESQFKIDDMEATVNKIDEAVARTLALAPMICNPKAEQTTKKKVLNLLEGKKSVSEEVANEGADIEKGRKMVNPEKQMNKK